MMASKKTRKTARKHTVAGAVATLKAAGQKRVLVVGRVRKGKIQIDQAKLDEFARKFPNATGSFIAVNAPFDPTAHVADG